jgi:hypothetical protein
MEKQKLWRHGEIIFRKIDKLPEDLIESKTKTFIKGKSNNLHTFDNGKLYLKNIDNYVFGYFIAENTKLYHIEHGDIKNGKLLEAILPNGIYELRRQNEFTPTGLKQVID